MTARRDYDTYVLRHVPSVDFSQDPITSIKAELLKSIQEVLAACFDRDERILFEASFVSFMFNPLKSFSPEPVPERAYRFPSEAELYAMAPQLVEKYKTMNSSSVTAFLQRSWPIYQLQKRQKFAHVALNFIKVAKLFFDFVDKNESLLDYTFRNKFSLVEETLAMKIRGHVTDIPDSDVCNVTVKGPDHAGTFFLHMSKADLDNFKKFASTTITYFPTGEKAGHALMITHNHKTQAYHIYDPNGAPELTNFSKENLLGFVKAVHRGLLRPLLAEPFAVSFQTFFEGIQGNERMRSFNLISRLKGNAYNKLLNARMRSKLINYLTPRGGFCKTWSTFMVVDNFQTGLVCYSLFEAAFVYNNARTLDVIEHMLTLKWLKKFCHELGVIYEGEPPKAVKDLLMEMALPIFVRVLAQYFLDQSAKGAHLGQEQRWWPVASGRTGKDFAEANYTLVTLITPEGPLLDFEKNFDNAKKDLHKSRFPFVNDRTTKTVYEFAIDAKDPIPRRRAQLLLE